MSDATLTTCDGPGCNTQFEAYRGQRFCSNRCRVARWREDKGLSTGPREVNCAHCGDAFQLSGKSGQVQKYCSDLCRYLASRERRRVRHQHDTQEQPNARAAAGASVP